MLQSLTALFDPSINHNRALRQREPEHTAMASPFRRIHPIELLFSSCVVAVWDSQVTADFIEGMDICLDTCSESNDCGEYSGYVQYRGGTRSCG